MRPYSPDTFAQTVQWRNKHAVHVAGRPCRPLYEAFKALRDGPTWSGLSTAQQRIVENELRDFVLGGVALEVCVSCVLGGAGCAGCSGVEDELPHLELCNVVMWDAVCPMPCCMLVLLVSCPFLHVAILHAGILFSLVHSTPPNASTPPAVSPGQAKKRFNA